ncbi:hypothetical protein ACOMHN_010578 [Nucella lapillus]
MGWLEEKMLETCPWTIDPAIWKRYIDDIITIWLYGEDELNKFMTWTWMTTNTLVLNSHIAMAELMFHIWMSVCLLILTDILPRTCMSNPQMPP